MTTSIGSLSTLDPQQLASVRRLQQIDRAIARNVQRITTLKRINSAADDPAGISLVSRLENEQAALSAVSSGLAQAGALVNTAGGAAGKIVDQLNQAQTLVLAAAGGTLSSSQIAANQAQLDSVLASIDSLSHADFNGRPLLDGSSSFRATGVNAAQFTGVRVLDKQTPDDVAVSVNVDTQATQATNSYTGGTLATAASVTISGHRGTTTVSLASGATTDDIAAAFNSASYLTGVSATKVDGTTVNFNTADYGSSAKLSFNTTSGTFNLATGGTTQGTDAVATINGQSVTGDGTSFTVNTGGATLRITASPAASGPLQSFTVTGKGLQFTLGENPANSVRFGLPELTTATLGGVDGNLHSLASGGVNSLTGGNAAAASRIITSALEQVSTSQAALGSFQRYTLGAAASVADSASENVASALNSAAGADIASETAQLATNQLLQAATLQSLQIFNQQRQNLLSLLSGLTVKA